MIGIRQDTLVLYSALTFRHLLDSLARPGKINQLEYPSFLGEPPSYLSPTSARSVPINFYALGALLTLLDRETNFVMAAEGQWLPPTDPAVQWLLLRSGTNLAPPEHAAFAFFCDRPNGKLLEQVNMGTLLEPESSTTIIYCVDQITTTVQALEWPDGSVALELSGPGIEEQAFIAVSGIGTAELSAIFSARRGYPLGIDLYLMDARGLLVGLPRTTRIRRSDQDE